MITAHLLRNDRYSSFSLFVWSLRCTTTWAAGPWKKSKINGRFENFPTYFPRSPPGPFPLKMERAVSNEAAAVAREAASDALPATCRALTAAAPGKDDNELTSSNLAWISAFNRSAWSQMDSCWA